MKKKKNSETRPWGSYEILREKEKYKLKEIIVNPGQKISYQSHHQRTEVWVITSGQGIVTLEGQKLDCFSGRSFFIPKESKHRIECTSEEPLIFVEVQTGTYFGEDDITRFEDDYGRL